MWDVIQQLQGREELNQFIGLLTADRIARYKSGTVNYMNVVGLEGEPGALNSPGAYEFLMGEKHLAMAPNWQNQVTIESLEKMLEYDVTSALKRVSPTPLLMILAEHDTLIPIDLVKEAYKLASEPKDILILPCGHFDVYNKEPWFTKAAGAAVEWFKNHIG